jgi:thioesterase domain-containing protein/acyl carrier protein
MHPALLDMATGCALYLIAGYGDSKSLYLPVSYQKLRSYTRIPSKVYSHIRSRNENTRDREIAVFDVTLFNEQGEVVADAEGFTMRRIAEASVASLGSMEPLSGRSDTYPPESSEELGIRPLDGARALVRILAAEAPPVVVVSPQNLTEVEARVTQSSQDTEASSPAEDEIEGAVIAWWRELLGVEQIGLDDDFFDLGGHSLIAVRLFAKVKKAYHVDLALSTLFEARTVRQLVALIRSTSAPVRSETKAWSPLVPIQPNGSKPPLFLVHGLGPSLLFYQELANHLGPDQPVYGLQSPLTSEGQKAPESIEELASIYVAEVRRLRTEGPYLVGGASLGGLIALEMSRQLDAKGMTPDLLLLLDTAIPGIHQRVPAGEQILQHWQDIRHSGVKYLLERSEHKINFYRSKFVRHLSVIACRCHRRWGWPLPAGLRHLPVELAHESILRRYRVQVYPGKVTLLRAVDHPRTVGTRWNSTLGWDKYAAGGLEVYDVPGEHNSMFKEPNVRTLAETIRTVLRKPSIRSYEAGTGRRDVA